MERKPLSSPLSGFFDIFNTSSWRRLPAVRNNERRWFDNADIEEVMAHNRKYALLNSADMYFNDYFDTASPDDPEAMRLTTSDIYDYIRKRAGSRAVTESITVFGRYFYNRDNPYVK